MHKLKLLGAAAAVLVMLGVPAFSQMVGGAGANVGESPQDARETDQAFDDLKTKGALEDQTKSKAKDELVIGADLVHQQKYADAIPHLEQALIQHPHDVNTLIYLGFSHRMLGSALSGQARIDEYTKALGYYRQGLELDARNKLLHEYAGKLYILLHDQASAENEQKALQGLCPSGCDELDALSTALVTYEAIVKVNGPAQPPK